MDTTKTIKGTTQQRQFNMWHILVRPFNVTSLIMCLFLTTGFMSQGTGKTMEVNLENLLDELEKRKVQQVTILASQAILETGWFECTDCSLDKNNLFGLWNHRKKEYFCYETWQESIEGYKRGIQYKYDPSKYKDYYEFLEELGYATDPEYINKLKKIEAWIQQYQDTKK